MLNKSPRLEKEKFFNAVEHEPFVAAMILAKHLMAPKSDVPDLIFQDINSAHIEKLVHGYYDLSSTRKQLLDPETTLQLNTLCQHLLKSCPWARKLNEASLVKLGEQPDLLRWSLYRLMQHHNPEQAIKVESKLFDESGIKHTYEQVAKIYAQAHQIPSQPLLSLAISHAHAKVLLLELSHHPKRFELFQNLIEKYPALADELALHWQQLLQTNARPEKEVKALKQAAKALAPKHPEFRAIAQVKRRIRHRADPDKTSNPLNFEKYAATSWVALNLPRIATVTHSLRFLAGGFARQALLPTIGSIGYSAAAVTTTTVAPIVIYQGLKYFMPSKPSSEPENKRDKPKTSESKLTS